MQRVRNISISINVVPEDRLNTRKQYGWGRKIDLKSVFRCIKTLANGAVRDVVGVTAALSVTGKVSMQIHLRPQAKYGLKKA